ncbi:DNA polymerase III subunit delta' [Bacillus coahuilensis p1.1.43]|uniref:DNA polymerase III subunit delta' n=1 Tax=Bacillus coahuilensis p1.1.43 TaxID=1150625 RepID=A0A147K4Y6_9BACI|nr:DNA polymerase III subunit delta' [Bacillus coahuilensis]KUP04577.1 DNA polymerase III subunit delta' [Bacillus coahuilensis p1.1.43]
MSSTWNELEALQPIVLKMLRNSIEKHRIGHAYLFEGERGTGKLDTAILLAKRMFCETPVEYRPCEKCNNCQRIQRRNHPDVHIIEPDGLSIKKDQIRSLQEEFSKTGVESKHKFYIIDHGDKMTVNAANSLLKFLEEPEADTVAIIITEQQHRILPTILSRCQMISFQSLPHHVVKNRLVEEGVSLPIASLVSNLTNNYHEALELSSDEWFAQARKIVLKLYEVLRKEPMQALIYLQEEYLQHFKDKQQVERGLDLLLLLYKDLLYLGLNKQEELAYPDKLEQFQGEALHLSSSMLTDNMSIVLEAKGKLNANMNTQLLMEQLLLKLQGGYTFV